MVSWRQAETSDFWWRIYPNVTPVANHAWSDVCDDFDGLACQADHWICVEWTFSILFSSCSAESYAPKSILEPRGIAAFAAPGHDFADSDVQSLRT